MTKLFRLTGRYGAVFLLSACTFFIPITGCKTKQKSVAPVVRNEHGPEDKSAPDLQQQISDSSFKARTVAAKASVKVISGEEENSFNINLRIYTDSIIWISISPLLGIEVARIMVTRDSVQFMDRLNKKYSVSGYEKLNDLFQINVDFDIIQGILTGNLFAYKKNKFNSVYIEDRYYILSTLSKRNLKRSLEQADVDKPIVQDLWVDDNNFRITKLNVEDQRLGKSLLTQYEDHRATEGGLFPFKSQTVINSGKTISVGIEYQKLTLNTQIDFPFNIPAGYEKIE